MHAHHALPPRDSALTRIRSRRSIRGDHCYCLVIEMQLPCEVRAAATAFERLAHAIPAIDVDVFLPSFFFEWISCRADEEAVVARAHGPCRSARARRG